MAEWRQKRGFSWDEQVTNGYLLVPTIIHRQLAHIGLVGISESAIENYRRQQKKLKNNPKAYALSEEEAPVSIYETKMISRKVDLLENTRYRNRIVKGE